MSWVQIPVTPLVACHNNSNNSKTNSNQIDTILNLIEQLNQFEIPRKTDCNFSKTSLSLYQSCNLFVRLSHPQRQTITAIIMCAVYFDQWTSALHAVHRLKSSMEPNKHFYVNEHLEISLYFILFFNKILQKHLKNVEKGVFNQYFERFFLGTF